jgi:hypothetical protein
VNARRYTLVFHTYIGYGSYAIDHRKVTATLKDLEQHKRKGDLHFVIEGWPKITYPDGKPIGYAN